MFKDILKEFNNNKKCNYCGNKNLSYDYKKYGYVCKKCHTTFLKEHKQKTNENTQRYNSAEQRMVRIENR